MVINYNEPNDKFAPLIKIKDDFKLISEMSQIIKYQCHNNKMVLLTSKN